MSLSGSLSHDLSLVNLLNSDESIAKQFEILTKLGQGGFGVVFMVRSHTDKRLYALKLVPVRKIKRKSKLLKEAEHLSRFHHQNIIRYHNSWITNCLKSPSIDTFSNELENKQESDIIFLDCEFPSNESRKNREYVTSITFSSGSSNHQIGSNIHSNTSADLNRTLMGENLVIQMEYCPITLREYINNQAQKTVGEIEKILKEILSGLIYIHDYGFIHRDIKPENIFFDARNTIKIADFGLSQLENLDDENIDPNVFYSDQSSETSSVHGTLIYMAPEARSLCQKRYRKESDWYSVGIILLELVYNFGTLSHRYEVLSKIGNPVELPDDFDTHSIGSSYFKKNILSLLSHNPEERLSFQTAASGISHEKKDRLNFNCDICEVQLLLKEIKCHAESESHIEKRETLIRKSQGGGQIHHYCETCNIWCSGIEYLISHGKGMQHDNQVDIVKKRYKTHLEKELMILNELKALNSQLKLDYEILKDRLTLPKHDEEKADISKNSNRKGQNSDELCAVSKGSQKS